MKVFGRLLVCYGLLSAVAAVAAGPDWDAPGKRWWAHVQFLADDKLEGRDTGSAGFEKAATYVTEQFRKIGLKPAGEKGYAQSVEFNVMQIDENGSSIELVRDGKSAPVKLGDEAFFELVHSELPATAEGAAEGWGEWSGGNSKSESDGGAVVANGGGAAAAGYGIER